MHLQRYVRRKPYERNTVNVEIDQAFGRIAVVQALVRENIIQDFDIIPFFDFFLYIFSCIPHGCAQAVIERKLVYFGEEVVHRAGVLVLYEFKKFFFTAGIIFNERKKVFKHPGGGARKPEPIFNISALAAKVSYSSISRFRLLRQFE